MSKNENETKSCLANALGASRVVSIAGTPSGGPIDLLQLRAEIRKRLRSSGGRPTDPGWSVQRLVPFRGERWSQLEELAGRLSTEERRVSAGQLAALLIERALDGISQHEPRG
ncbi:MAG: hypothetical protein AB1505_20655 [Candidatus Latescibacterota bacterium]